MSRHSRETLRTLFVGVLVLALSTSPASAAVLAGSPEPGAAPAPAAISTVEMNENVSVWQFAPFPLRAAPSTQGTAIDNRKTVELNDGEGSLPLQKGKLSVYGQDEQLGLEFQDRMGFVTDQFDNESVDLVVAKLEPGSGFGGDDMSAASLYDTVNDLTTGEANDNATFYENEVTLDSEGNWVGDYDPDGPGQYVIMLARPDTGEGLNVTDGDLVVDGEATIIGVETAVVQAAAGTITDEPDAVVRGDNATFDVRANLGASETNHTVVLYRESQFNGSTVEVTVEGDLGDISSENVTVEDSLDYVHGSVSADQPVSVAGTTVGDGGDADVVSIAGLPEFVDAGAGETPPASGGSALNASVAAVADAGDEATLTVETLDDWTTGTYRYLYVAQGKTADEVSTATGTLQVTASTGDGGDGSGGDGPGGGGGGGGASGGGGGGGGAGPTLPPAISQRSAAIDPGTSVFETSFPSASAFAQFRIQFQPGTGGRVTIAEFASTPQFTGRLDGHSVVGVVNIDVPFGADEEPATMQATIRRSTLQQMGASPSALRIVHYDDGTGDWETLDTTVVREGADTVVVEATTPGFSIFAVTVAQTGTPTATPAEPAPTTAAAASPADEPTATPAEPAPTTAAAASPVQQPPSERGGLDPLPILVGLVLVAAALLAAYIIQEGDVGR
jgi:PGF-pre-PGF domain-containing protein